MKIAIVVALLAASVHATTCDKEIGKEYPLAGEAEIIKAVADGNEAAGTAQLPKEVVRGAHGKTSACAKATWEVNDDVPEELQHGVFKKGAKYDVWARFSNGQGNSKEGDDREPDVRGIALKLLNVEGEKNIPSDEENTYDQVENTTQDFIFISSHANAFFARTVLDYISPDPTCEPCKAATAEMGMWYKTANPLNVTYGSLVNYVLEPKGGSPVGIKYYIEPCDPDKTVASSAKTNGDPTSNRNFQRDAIAEQLDPSGGTAVCMVFGVQLQKDACKQPMEDTSIVWTTEKVPVATVRFPLQHTSNSNQLAMCENFAFNPWHSLKEHRPAGSVSRARKQIYLQGSSNRWKQNGGGCAHVNPTSTCLKPINDMLKSKCPMRI